MKIIKEANAAVKTKKSANLYESRVITEDADPEVTMVSGTDSEGKPLSIPELLSKTKNAVTDVLDEALDDARYAIKHRIYDTNCNVLIEGLPGSSKTASIFDWGDQNGIHIYLLDSKSPDLELLINGAAAINDAVNKDTETGTEVHYKQVVRAYSSVLDKLNEPNTVLFLDEYNRQKKMELRGSLLTLLQNRACAGPGDDGLTHFAQTSLLFTIAAINPTSETDKGATKLIPAELRRFQYQIKFDSNKDATKEYFKKHYNKEIIKSYNYFKGDIHNEDYIEELRNFLQSQDMGYALMRPAGFKYGGLIEYERTFASGKKLLCQSAVTELIAAARGEKDRMLKKLSRYGLSDEDTAMIQGFINAYTPKSLATLAAQKEKELGLAPGTLYDPSYDPSAETASTEPVAPGTAPKAAEPEAKPTEDDSTVDTPTSAPEPETDDEDEDDDDDDIEETDDMSGDDDDVDLTPRKKAKVTKDIIRGKMDDLGWFKSI